MPQVSLFFFVTAKAPTAVGQLPYARWVPSPLGPLRQLDELKTVFLTLPLTLYLLPTCMQVGHAADHGPPRANRSLMCSARKVKHVLRRTAHHRAFHRRFRQCVSRLITRLTHVSADVAEAHRARATRISLRVAFRRRWANSPLAGRARHLPVATLIAYKVLLR